MYHAIYYLRKAGSCGACIDGAFSSRVEDCSVQGPFRQGKPAFPDCGNREQMWCVQRLVQSNQLVARDSMHTLQNSARKGVKISELM